MASTFLLPPAPLRWHLWRSPASMQPFRRPQTAPLPRRPISCSSRPMLASAVAACSYDAFAEPVL